MQLNGGNVLPLSGDEFNDLMTAMDVGHPNRMAVAVSGGGDSMALTLLLEEWCKKENITLRAVTVDHGLRIASKKEAEDVTRWLKQYNIRHDILEWRGEKPRSNIQDAARNARYSLIAEWCKAEKIKYLFLAHHRDDQAETFLMRLLRGSGVDGLSAMKSVSSLPVSSCDNNEVKICRPLLSIGKERLLKTLLDADQNWISDPSNENDNFTRIKVRNLLENTNIDGLDREKLTATAAKMSRVKSLLDDLTDKAESTFVDYNLLGYASLSQNFDKNLHEEIMLRLISRVLKKVSGRAYPTRYQKLLGLLENIRKKDFSGQTLSGVAIFPDIEGQIYFVREAANIHDEKVISEKKQLLWDNRFIIHSGKNTGTMVAFSNEVMELVCEGNSKIKVEIYKVFNNHIIRDKLLPTLPVILTADKKVILPRFLLSERNEKLHDAFLATFKI